MNSRLESRFRRLATGGYVLGRRIVCCGIVAIRCHAVGAVRDRLPPSGDRWLPSGEPTLSLHLPALASSDNRIGPIINYLSSSNEPNHQTRLTPCFFQFDNVDIPLIFRIEGVWAVRCQA